MGILLGRNEKRQWIPEPPVPPYPGAPVPGNPGGGQLGRKMDSALQVSTCWSCVSLIANVISTFQLDAYTPGSDGAGPRMALIDPPPKVLTNPEADLTQSEWLHMLLVSLLLRGNGFGKVTEVNRRTGAIEGMQLQDPDNVRVYADKETGEKRFKLGSDEREYTAAEIWHVKGMTLPGALTGLSPISYAAAILGRDLAAGNYGSDYFRGSLVPKAVVESEQAFDQEQAFTLKQRIIAATQNREPIVMGAGAKYVPLSIKPEESQFLATQQATVNHIARYYNVPPEMVGGEGAKGLTYSNVEQRSIDFLTYTINFWLKRIEDASYRLLSGPQFARFDPSPLLRLDAISEASVHIQEIVSRVKAPSEIRADKNLPPMTDEQLAEMENVPLQINVIGGSKIGAKQKPPNINPDDPYAIASNEPQNGAGK